MSLIDKINENVKDFGPNQILGFNHKISGIDGLIPLTVGEPDLKTPDHIKLSAINAIINNQSHYTDPRGIEPLRKAASKYFKDKYNLEYDLDSQILTTVGVTEAINATFRAILNPGDTVIVPSPTYSMYVPDIKIMGAKPIYIDTTSDGYHIDPKKLNQAIKDNKDTVKAVIINYPNNPTGVTYDVDELKSLARVISKYDIFCITDEIYSELSYNFKHVSMGTILPNQTIVLNGVSKSHSMTGWRIGFVCGPSEIIDKISKVHQFMTSSPATNAQYAALDAFEHGFYDGNKVQKIYYQRRKILVDGLNKTELSFSKPIGAFYVFAKIPDRFTQDDFKFAYQLAKEAKVGTIPGSIFGAGGKGYVRISYSIDINDLKEAISRIDHFLKSN